MSFRKYGGTNYSSKHNLVNSHINNSQNLSVGDTIGQENSYINILSNIKASGNIDCYGNIVVTDIYALGDIDCSENIKGTDIRAYGDIDCSGNIKVTNIRASEDVDCSGNIKVTNIRTSGDIDCSGNIKVTNIRASGHCNVRNLALPQGSYVNWNDTCGDGEMDFICSKGGGYGGFYWYNIASNEPNQNPSALMELDSNGHLYANDFSRFSDYRIKENVISLDDYKDKDKFTVDKLRPVHYTHKESQKESLGLIAHEVQEVFPFLVRGEKDAEKMQSLNYIGLIPVLIKEIQDLKKELSEIKKQINN